MDIIKKVLDSLEDEKNTTANEKDAKGGVPDELIDPDKIELTSADEAAIFLAALESVSTPDEYKAIVTENAVELELYQLIDSASVATEAHRYVVTKTRKWDMNREEKKAALRLAAKADSSDYRQYVYHRGKMIEYRTKIFEKFGAKARMEAKRIVQNSRRKASSMNSNVGKSIVDKMDKKIAEATKKAEKDK